MIKIIAIVPDIEDCELLEDLLKKEIWRIKSDIRDKTKIQKHQQWYDCIIDIKQNLMNESTTKQVNLGENTSGIEDLEALADDMEEK